jgi:hypothetical protein
MTIAKKLSGFAMRGGSSGEITAAFG